jgi:DNA-binding MarR family transcriptional regulator
MSDRDGAPVARALLHRHALASDRHRAAVSQQLGFDESEALALAHLALLGSLTPGQLAALLLMTTGGMTALARRLERAGRVVRGAHPESRRSRLLTPTPSVLATIRQEAALIDERLEHVGQGQSAEEREVIVRFLTQVVAVSEEHARRAADLQHERAISPP